MVSENRAFLGQNSEYVDPPFGHENSTSVHTYQTILKRAQIWHPVLLVLCMAQNVEDWTLPVKKRCMNCAATKCLHEILGMFKLHVTTIFGRICLFSTHVLALLCTCGGVRKKYINFFFIFWINRISSRSFKNGYSDPSPTFLTIFFWFPTTIIFHISGSYDRLTNI